MPIEVELVDNTDVADEVDDEHRGEFLLDELDVADNEIIDEIRLIIMLVDEVELERLEQLEQHPNEVIDEVEKPAIYLELRAGMLDEVEVEDVEVTTLELDDADFELIAVDDEESERITERLELDENEYLSSVILQLVDII